MGERREEVGRIVILPLTVSHYIGKPNGESQTDEWMQERGNRRRREGGDPRLKPWLWWGGWVCPAAICRNGPRLRKPWRSGIKVYVCVCVCLTGVSADISILYVPFSRLRRCLTYIQVTRQLDAEPFHSTHCVINFSLGWFL